MTNRKKLFACCTLTAALFGAFDAMAQTPPPDISVRSAAVTRIAAHDKEALLAEAREHQYVAVTVYLDVPVPLLSGGPKFKIPTARIKAAEEAVLAAVDGDILPLSVASSGLGQISFLANERALELLMTAPHVAGFGRDTTLGMRTKVYDPGDRLARIEAEIARNGYADVEVMEHVDDLEFDFRPDGRSRVHSRRLSAQTKAMAAAPTKQKRQTILDALPEGAALNLADAKAAADRSASPTHRLRIDRNGLSHLRRNEDIREIRLVGEPEVEPVQLDPEVLEAARTTDGTTSILVDLQNFSGYSPMKSRTSAAAWKSQNATIRRVFDEIFGALDPEAAKNARHFEGIPTAEIRLSTEALDRLYANPDPRIRSVGLNRADIKPFLLQSTGPGRMNVQQAWKAARGAGQYIAILDSGVDTKHPFLAKKITAGIEACFGTTDSLTTSLCSNPNSQGNSVGAGTGAPVPSTLDAFWHGTHVAGIAAGGPGTATELSGVAPDAKIVPMTIFSRNNGSNGLNATKADVLEALQMIRGFNIQNITVNMSFGGDKTNASCYVGGGIDIAVQGLMAANIPVVASTGNDGSRYQITFPACINNVIKVSATNDIGSVSIWYKSNLANPKYYKGPFFLAPGTEISSSVPTTRNASGYEGADGTSQAAPHVSGLYALLKGVCPACSVADMTNWIESQGNALRTWVYAKEGPAGGGGWVDYKQAYVRDF